MIWSCAECDLKPSCLPLVIIMALHGLCPECDRLLAQYQNASVELHGLAKQLTDAARIADKESYTLILAKCDRQVHICDELRALFHQHAISDHGRRLRKKPKQPSAKLRLPPLGGSLAS